MLAVWNQQKRIIRSRDQIFPLIKYKPFEGTNFTNGLDNSNKKFNVGKSWYIDMLRRKSKGDLEKLWYSLLREKLAIQSDKYSLTQKNLRIRDEVKTAFSKVCVSMSRIKTVFAEREKINNEFNMLLEYWYIRNKQMSKNKFEVTKTIVDWAKKKEYIRMPLEDPKSKNKLLQELKVLDRDKDRQLKKTQESVIQEKKKEINLLKEEIQERVLDHFIQEKERLKKLHELNTPSLENQIKAARQNLKELKFKRTAEKDEKIIKETTKSMRKLAVTIDRLKLKIDIDSKNAEKEKQEATYENSNEHKKEKAQETIMNNSKNYAKITENTEATKAEEVAKNKKTAESAKKNSSSDIVNFKKNPISKNQSTDIQNKKTKKATKDSAASNGEKSAQAEESEGEAKETEKSKVILQSDEAQKKMDVQAYKQTLTKKQIKELEDKIKKTLRGKVTRLGVKYRAILADHKKITFDKVAPYRRRLFNEIKNLDDITKVGYEYNTPKPKILEPIKVNTTDPKYQDILLGKVKAPVPYMKKKIVNNKYVKVLSRKEISHAKNLIQRKNKRQILSQYVKNVDMIGKTGKINAYNKIQKIRSKQAKDIFQKELSALKHHLKQPQSFYKKFQNKENEKNKKE